MALRKTLKRCPGQKEHSALRGQDPKTRMSHTVLAMIFTHKLCTAICIDIETFHITKPSEVKLCLLSEDFAYFGLNDGVTSYPSEDSLVYWKCKKCKH